MRRVMGEWKILVGAVVCLVLAVSSASAFDEDLASLDLQELMDVEVVTVARRAEPFSQVPGAVAFLDEEDIFHSGATTLPEVLGLLPGVRVSQVDLDKWAVGVRGFTGILSSKHLVLVDGRPVTSPTTGDVTWGNLIPLSLVKRIELVRGPWTHLWGADSFTGVINVITKTAAETQGGQGLTAMGTSGVEQSFRYGGELGETGSYRAYASAGRLESLWSTEQRDGRGSDNWRKWQTGTRIDWENAFTDSLSFQADMVGSSIEDGAGGSKRVYKPHERDTLDGYAQFNWNRALGLDAALNFRTSYTHSSVAVDDLKGGTNTLDAEVQHSARQMGVHRLTWGVGTRYYWDGIRSGKNTTISRERRYTFTANGFAQDRLTLAEDSLFLFLGAKLDYFGKDAMEIQPTARLLHTREETEYWLAVSRAVRADTRWQRSGNYSMDVGGTVYTVKAPDSLLTEKMIAYEAGHRWRLSPDLSWDTSFYINDYDDLITLDYDSATTTATLTNGLKGTAYGLETSLEWRVNDAVQLNPVACVLYQKVYGMEQGLLGDSMPDEGGSYALKLHTRFKTTDTTGLDFLTGYEYGPRGRKSDGALSLQAHAYWRASPSLMVELIGRNLVEASEEYATQQVGPSATLRMTWDF